MEGIQLRREERLKEGVEVLELIFQEVKMSEI